MGESTEIAWTDATFNPWWGCVRVSEACRNCYAEVFAKRVGQDVWGPTARRRFFGDKHWNELRKWNEAAKREGKRRKVFVASMADVFERLPDEHPDAPRLDLERLRLFRLMPELEWLDFQCLTKRPENILDMVPTLWLADWPSNVWVGTTAETQDDFERRATELLKVPAPVRFLSCEPLLEELDLDPPHCQHCARDTEEIGVASDGATPWCMHCDSEATHGWYLGDADEGIGWVIVGGESGAGARPMREDWVRAIVKQCQEEEVPVFVKQLGALELAFEFATHETWVNKAQSWFKSLPRKGYCFDQRGRRLKNGADFARSRDENAFPVGVYVNREGDSKGGDVGKWPPELVLREFPQCS